MATTQNTFTGDGSNLGPFSFTFKWLEPTDIKVTVAGVLKTVGTHYNLQSLNYTTKTGGQVLFTAGNAPANGAAIVIYRQTDDTDLAATFYSGSAIRAQDLNNNFVQGLYVTQESSNNATTAIGTANTALTNSSTAISTANTALSTANTASSNASAAVSTANTASSNASAAVSTANTASSNATNAVNTANAATVTANSAAADAATAISTANGAVSTANSASTAATNAVNTANAASSAASSAVSTANTASTNASNAVTTANTASTNATTAVNTANAATVTANAAAAAVANAVLYTTVANVAAIPATPANNTAVEVTNSTGIESFTPLSGLPVGFVGSSGLSVRIIYQTAGTTWTWIQYFPNDPENRYLKEAGDTMTGALGVTAGTAAAPSIFVSGDTNTGIYSPGADQVAISTGGSGRLFVDASGRIALGGATVTDSNLLNIQGSTATHNVGVVLNKTNGTAQVWGIQNSGSLNVFNYTASSTALTIDTSNRLGVGTSAPQQLLQVGGFSGSNGITVGAGSSNYSFIYLADGTGGTEAYRGYLQYNHAADKLELGSAGTTAITVDSSQRVGVGTTSPSAKLHVDAGSSTLVNSQLVAGTSGFLSYCYSSAATGSDFYGSSNASTSGIQAFGSAATYGTFGAFPLVLGTNNAERLRIDSSGRVGIGTSSPVNALDVNGSIGVLYSDGLRMFRNQQTVNNTLLAHTYTGGNDQLNIAPGGNSPTSAIAFQTATGSTLGTRMFISPAGNVGIGTTNPNAAFVVSSAGVNGIEFANTSPSSSLIQAYNRSTSAYSDLTLTASTHIFGIAGSERARIDSSGRLLVGTSSAVTTTNALTAKLQAQGTNAFDTGIAGGLWEASSNPFPLHLVKSRGATVGTHTVVQNGDGLGRIIFGGSDGTDFEAAAYVECLVDGTPGANDMPGRLVFSTTADGASSPTERMKINSNGKISASHASNATGIEFSSTIGSGYTDALGVLSFTNYSPNNTTARFLYCGDNAGGATVRAEIRSNGGLANYQANNVNLSDRNSKKDISPAADTWNCLKEWEIVNYRYKDQPDDADLNLGVIAQQVAENCPEVITVFQEAKPATEDRPAQEERLGVKEQQMYWMAIKALQEAQVRIEQLEQRLSDAGI